MYVYLYVHVVIQVSMEQEEAVWTTGAGLPDTFCELPDSDAGNGASLEEQYMLQTTEPLPSSTENIFCELYQRIAKNS